MGKPIRGYRGRLAPSPTGSQHVGNARTFLLAWLQCRANEGELILRIEDLDTPRTKEGADRQAVEDLKWLGLDWDSVAPLQSARVDRYEEILGDLKSRELVYPCTCSRSAIELSSSAPHESVLDGSVYPGTCSTRSVVEAKSLDAKLQRYSWRFRISDEPMDWEDDFRGPQKLEAKRFLGDFVVGRNYGPIAYQLAVVIDDHDQGITHVVRGDDLIYSTYRQLSIYEVLGWSAPGWCHVPLVVGIDGKRLAKRHGDTRLSHLRDKGIAPEALLGSISQSLKLTVEDSPVSANDLLQIVKRDPGWLHRVPAEPWSLPKKITSLS